jgi:hypothetical protein
MLVLFEAITSGVSLCGIAMYMEKKDLKGHTRGFDGNSNIFHHAKKIYLLFYLHNKIL